MGSYSCAYSTCFNAVWYKGLKYSLWLNFTLNWTLPTQLIEYYNLFTRFCLDIYREVPPDLKFPNAINNTYFFLIFPPILQLYQIDVRNNWFESIQMSFWLIERICKPRIEDLSLLSLPVISWVSCKIAAVCPRKIKW